ncbi:MAG: hypothetical protein KKD01_12515 [Proteobacteria bacterium]|nr:hypothetical protein [Pseudomonadota bacterium]MBU1137995.1 hypothetical protein [Pseudomonadota bacterium]MBU1231441.1 hypothetical protein [Pseudomonadota bacterium]MBU1420215.1 hypothetical protein [Pseudomonadota bacterium]MBU1455544.1 hypothetical protein [Pseudomonadota bacterium]
MSILDKESIFTSMLQDGPFSVKEMPPFVHPFSKEAKEWVSSLQEDQLMKTKYRAVRSQIFDFLGVTDFDEILSLIYNQSLRDSAAKRARILLGNMFGIVQSGQDVRRYLRDYAATADDVVNSLRAKVLAPYSSHIETTNEIETTHDPVDLLLIIFNEHFHKKARFEAKRKLVLMNLAGSIDQRERETDIEKKFSDFITFLNVYVWSPSCKIGDLKIHYLHSRHRDDDFSCEDVKVVSEDQAMQMKPVAGEKLTLVKRRTFRNKEREIPIYVTIRKKPPSAKVLKLLRKNEKNPATAVDDELGLMAVLNSVGDVKCFVRHLTRSAVHANSFMTLEDISDTLTGGEYTGSATGSSGKTPMLKFFARLGGMRVEFIIHTNRSYLNYIYQRDVAHDEYEVKRIFDTGVAEFLFPWDIYRLNMNEIRSRQIQRFRRRIEEW